RILSPIAGALHYAHVSGTLHGNLHPGNLLFGQHNDLLLTEFSLSQPGLASSLDDEEFAIPYMAPEHLRGQPTFASDQYALAVMVYEWLCGRRPYEATERELLLQQQQEASFPSPRSLNDAISPAVERVVLQALSTNPDERFPHAQAFADHYLSALMGFAVRSSEPVGARLIKPVPPTPTIPPDNGSANTLTHASATADGNSKVNAINPIPTLHNGSTDVLRPVAAHNGTSTADAINPTPTSQDDTDTTQPVATRAVEHNTDALQPVAPQSSNGNADTIEPISKRLYSDTRLRATIIEDLCQGGVLSQSLPGYEERPAQIEMATLVAHSLVENVPAIVEAGTGTGKSLAYLVPVVRSGKVAIVSTANKALQEQLFYKDIPFVQQHVKHFEAALVKGVNNYVCLDRVELERVGMQYYTKNREFRRLLDIVNDPESTFMGDFETLGFQMPNDVRARVATDSDQCAWSKCSFFSECYVRQMRERAELAQVIVVNHTLLLLDAAIGGFLLPERDVIILDEAHHLEEEATRSFTITISPAQVQTLLAQRLLKDHSQVNLQDDALKAAQEMWVRLELVANPGYKGRVNLEAPLEEGLRLATVIADLGESLRRLRPKDMPEKETQLYDKLLKRTQNLADNIRTVFSVAQPDKFVYYVDRVEGGPRGGFPLQASAAPLDVTKWLKERLFNKCNVISISATLATIGPNPANPEDKGPNFAYFRRRVGLDPAERPDVLERILPLAFDYESNALLYLPRDLPEPTYGAGSDE
ncbi:MAG: protein kinase, partial [Chloroflexi bacterium]|nr:protein kinase [Chloroflexota bacterium]